MPEPARTCFICGDLRGWAALDEWWEIVGIGVVRMSVRVCSGCGLVLQDPAPPERVLQDYYEVLSNYTNPGRAGRPSAHKAAVVEQQMAFVENSGAAAGSAFQVGCSDGYTLSRFRDRGWRVDGVDPSRAAHDVAVELYGIDTRVGFFEDTPVHERFDLVVATHVLEHLRDPVESLVAMKSLLDGDGSVFIEVPCLVEPALWPNGYFTIEHLQYFSETSLDNCLRAAGLRWHAREVVLDAGHYPVLRVLARASEEKSATLKGDFDRARGMVEEYLSREEAEGWGRISALLERELPSAKRVVIWGGGVHTSQLLVRTPILELCDPEMIVDSDPQKQGLKLGRIDVRSPEEIRAADGLVVVISTLDGQAEIWKATSGLRHDGVRVLPLYPMEDNGGG